LMQKRAFSGNSVLQLLQIRFDIFI
jgi:hypothetical protein